MADESEQPEDESTPIDMRVRMTPTAFEQEGANCPRCGTHTTLDNALEVNPIGAVRGKNPQRYTVKCPLGHVFFVTPNAP